MLLPLLPSGPDGVHNRSLRGTRLSLLPVTQKMMASQKLANCCVAAIALVASTYISTPHRSTIARLAFGAFCLATDPVELSSTSQTVSGLIKNAQMQGV